MTKLQRRVRQRSPAAAVWWQLIDEAWQTLIMQSVEDVLARPTASSTAGSSAGDGEREDDGPDGAFEALARTAGLRQAARDAARTLDATLAELEAHSSDSERLASSRASEGWDVICQQGPCRAWMHIDQFQPRPEISVGGMFRKAILSIGLHGAGFDFFGSMAETLGSELRAPANAHLRKLHAVAPALTVAAAEAALVAKDALRRRRRDGPDAGFMDDGFALGLAFALKVWSRITVLMEQHWGHGMHVGYRGSLSDS